MLGPMIYIYVCSNFYCKVANVWSSLKVFTTTANYLMQVEQARELECKLHRADKARPILKVRKFSYIPHLQAFQCTTYIFLFNFSTDFGS